MLTKEIFLQGMNVLSVLKQGRRPVDLDNKFTLKVWYEALKDIPDEAFQKACIYLLKTSEWHPSPAEIREAAGFACDVQSGTDFTAEQQWEVFKNEVCHGKGRRELDRAYGNGEQPFEDPVTNEVARTIYEEYALSDVSETGNWMSRFIKAYNNVKKHGKRRYEMQSIGDFKAIGSNQKAVTA